MYGTPAERQRRPCWLVPTTDDAMPVSYMMYTHGRNIYVDWCEFSEGRVSRKGRSGSGGYSSNTCVLVARVKFKHGAGNGRTLVPRVRMAKRRGAAAMGKTLYWLLLTLLVLAGPLCPCAAAAASQKTYYTGKITLKCCRVEEISAVPVFSSPERRYRCCVEKEFIPMGNRHLRGSLVADIPAFIEENNLATNC